MHVCSVLQYVVWSRLLSSQQILQYIIFKSHRPLLTSSHLIISLPVVSHQVSSGLIRSHHVSSCLLVLLLVFIFIMSLYFIIYLSTSLQLHPIPYHILASLIISISYIISRHRHIAWIETPSTINDSTERNTGIRVIWPGYIRVPPAKLGKSTYNNHL